MVLSRAFLRSMAAFGIAVASALLLAGPVAAAPPMFTVTELGSINDAPGRCTPGGYPADPEVGVPFFSEGLGINSSGTSVGWSNYNCSDGSIGATTWNHGVARQIVPPPTGDSGWDSEAVAVNDVNQIVGAWGAIQGTGNLRPVLWSGGTSVDLFAKIPGCEPPDVFEPPLCRGVARAINSFGDIVGTSTNYDAEAIRSTRGFLYSSSGTLTFLGTLGGEESGAYGINDSRQIVGSATTALGFSHAFLLSGAHMIDLGTLGGTTSTATAINPNGLIVGVSTTAGELQSNAFLYSNGAHAKSRHARRDLQQGECDQQPRGDRRRIDYGARRAPSVSLLRRSHVRPQLACVEPTRHPRCCQWHQHARRDRRTDEVQKQLSRLAGTRLPVDPHPLTTAGATLTGISPRRSSARRQSHRC